jgi:hypothetical protein
MGGNRLSLWLNIKRLIILVGFVSLLIISAAWAEAQGTNYSLRFYGHGVADIDRVKIPIDPPVPADVGYDFTLEFWMKAELTDNDVTPSRPCGDYNWIYGNIIFDRDLSGSDAGRGDYGISIYQGRIRFGVSNPSYAQTICGGTNVADGQWHHIAVTRRSSDGRLRIYIDGQQEAEGTGPTGDISFSDGQISTQPNDPYLVIGAEKHDFNEVEYPPYNGLIDEVRLSNIVRYSSNFTPRSTPFTSDGNTAALYHFDEGPAGACTGMVQDSSGASGGPSSGTCQFGGTEPAGPVYTTDTPFTGPDTTPPVITNVGSGSLDTIALITWNTDEPATSQVEYGVNPTLSISTTETTGYVTSHIVTLTGLFTNTTYVYRVYSKDAAGNPAASEIFSFTTLTAEDLTRIYLPVIFKSF